MINCLKLTSLTQTATQNKETYHVCVVFKLVSQVEMGEEVGALHGRVTPGHGRTHRTHLGGGRDSSELTTLIFIGHWVIYCKTRLFNFNTKLCFIYRV